jgi:hypothetical protein
MLLKWVFTILSILWLIQALRPYFETQPPPPPPRPKPDPRTQEAPKPDPDDDSEYIDYEEIK